MSFKLKLIKQIKMGNLVCHYCKQEQSLNKYNIDNQIVMDKKKSRTDKRAVTCAANLQSNPAISKDFRHLTDDHMSSSVLKITAGDETQRNQEEVRLEVIKEFKDFNAIINSKKGNSNIISKSERKVSKSEKDGKIIERSHEEEISTDTKPVSKVVLEQTDKNINKLIMKL